MQFLKLAVVRNKDTNKIALNFLFLIEEREIKNEGRGSFGKDEGMDKTKVHYFLTELGQRQMG